MGLTMTEDHEDCRSGQCRSCAERLWRGTEEGQESREGMNVDAESYGSFPQEGPPAGPVMKR